MAIFHTTHRKSSRSQPVYANALNFLGTGGSGEGYCKWMCSCMAAKGWRSVVLNYRGCAGLELTSPTLYCASFTDDVHLAVEEIHHQFPNARLFAAGYSLGSLILCKYLAEAANGTWKVKGMIFRNSCMSLHQRSSRVQSSSHVHIGSGYIFQLCVLWHFLDMSSMSFAFCWSIAYSCTAHMW